MSAETNQESEINKFIKEIDGVLDKGEGFAVFCGAGVSRASGIMIGRRFDEYLPYVFCRCVMTEKEQMNMFFEGHKRPQRNLSRDGWPDFPRYDQMQVCVQWIALVFLRCALLRIVAPGKIDDGKDPVGKCCIELNKWKIQLESNGDLPEPSALELQSLVEQCLDHLNNPKHFEKLLLRPLLPRLLSLGDLNEALPRWVGMIANGNADAKLDGLKLQDARILSAWGVAHGKEALRNLTLHGMVPGHSLSDASTILESGLRSLCDWRSALGFLARLRLHPSGYLEMRGETEQRLIDSFNIHLVQGRRPNLTHRMLAHLSRPLRIETYLTTNFDTLIEESFEDLKYPLATISLTLDGNLPDPMTVLGQRTLIKLHGTQHDTRADFSLDTIPSLRDQKTMAQYLQFEDEEPNLQKHLPNQLKQQLREHLPNHVLQQLLQRQPKHLPKHLLVLGCSGSDERMNQYFNAVLRMRPQVKIFWIAHTRPEDCRQKLRDHLGNGRVHVVESRHTDLLLYELYQHVSHRLPPSGYTYQFLQHIPAWHKDLDSDAAQNQLKNLKIDDCVKKLAELLKPAEIDFAQNWQAQKNLRHFKDLTFYSFPGAMDVAGTELQWARWTAVPGNTPASKMPAKDWCGQALVIDTFSGVSPIMQRLYETLQRQYRECLWLESEDFATPSALATECLSLMALRLGRFDATHANLTINESDLTDESLPMLTNRIKDLFSQYFDASGQEWVIFIYDRNTPGSCAGWKNITWAETNPEEFRALNHFITALLQCKVSVVVLPYTQARHRKFQLRQNFVRKSVEAKGGDLASLETARWTNWDSNIRGNKLENRFFVIGADHKGKLTDDSWHGSALKAPSRFHKIQEFLKGDQPTERLRFLYSLCLFRQSRHPASRISHAAVLCPDMFNTAFSDNDEKRYATTEQWTDQLVNGGVMHRKTGGYLWMYADVRQPLIDLLGVEQDEDQVQMRCYRSSIHYWIGEWFLHAFYSSEHVSTVIESLYHRFCAIRHLRDATNTHLEQFRAQRGGVNDPAYRRELLLYRTDLLRISLLKAVKTMMVAWKALAYWTQTDAIIGMFARENLLDAVNLGPDWSQKTTGWLAPLVFGPKMYPLTGEELSLLNDLQTTFSPLVLELLDAGHRIQLRLRIESGEMGYLPGDGGRHDVVSSGYPASGDRLLRVDPWHAEDYRIHGKPSLTAAVLRSSIEGYLSTHRDDKTKSGESQLSESAINLLGLGTAGHLATDPSERRKVFFAMRETFLSTLRLSQSGFLDFVRETMLPLVVWNIRVAKLKQRIEDRNPHGTAPPEFLHHWLATTVCCNLVIDLLAHMPVGSLRGELALRFEFHVNYALALGHLGRFSEAQRRLTEATFFLKQAPAQEVSAMNAVVHLRRAELDLVQARYYAAYFNEHLRGRLGMVGGHLPQLGGTLSKDPVDNKMTAYALHVAKINDAVSQLDIAEGYLKVGSRSTTWWSRLLSLRFWCVSSHMQSPDPEGVSLESLVFRGRINYGEKLNSWFDHAVHISTKHSYHRIRLLQNFCKACQRLQSHEKDPGGPDNFVRTLQGHANFAGLSKGQVDQNSIEGMLEQFVFASSGETLDTPLLSPEGTAFWETTVAELTKAILSSTTLQP
ncbi:SIR2 family protein [Verrucomicrobium sp. BvORR034]|uniref:SIR2 family protein n=1 Tax=Verrucomicrobium sp. BvORR034 TaxID=1396418 RepID=UPI000678BA7F|nr:SIR2 family protein [Verrucomicrobium sp. BvORR034]